MKTGRTILASSALILALFAGTAARGQQTGAPAGQKVIRDQAEYDAYKKAVDTKDPAQKGAALQAFAKQYPKSVVSTDALELAVAAYQAAGNQAKVLEAARQVLQLAPNSVRELAIITSIDRAAVSGASGADREAALKEGCADSQAGLAQLPGWKKPEGMSDADFTNLGSQIADIFNGEAGFCALENKDYAAARDLLTKAFAINPGNLADVYQLAAADLEMDPMDLNGLWYCSKAAGLAQKQNNAQAAQGISDYCKAKYTRYHGGADGWDQLSAGAAGQTAPPADFAKGIRPAPTPCEQAVKAVQDYKPADLSIRDWEFVLTRRDCSAANAEAAGKVWQALQDLEKQARLKLQAKVISATQESLEVAITDDNQKNNNADMHVILQKPTATPPAAGAIIAVAGEITKYSPSPFLFTMENGAIEAAPSGGAAPSPQK